MQLVTRHGISSPDALADTLLDQFQEWRDNLPSSLEDGATAEALDVVLELRSQC